MKNIFWTPFFLVVTAMAVVVLLPSRGLAACSPADVQSQFAAADVVATGTIYSLVTLDEGGSEAYLDPLTIYKGTDLVVDSLIVTVPDNAADRVDFVEGDAPYLLLLQSQDDGTFSTDVCSGTRLLGAGLTDAEKTVLGAGTDIANLVPAMTEGDQLPVDEPVDAVSPSAASLEERVATWVRDHRPWAIAIVVWNLFSQGLALWAAGRLNQRGWFIVLFILPTAGLLPLVYLFVIGKSAFRFPPPMTATKV